MLADLLSEFANTLFSKAQNVVLRAVHNLFMGRGALAVWIS
jgi:hypothetical protein